MYLGIDQSLNGTGLCLLSPSRTVEHLETVDPGKRRGPERLQYIRDHVKTFLPFVQFVTFEDFAYDSTSQHFALGGIRDVLQLLVYDHGIASDVVPILSLKKFATGNHKASKEQMVDAARKNGINVTDDNQADAYFLSLVAFHLHTGVQPQTRAALEVVHRMKNKKVKTVRRVRKLVKNSL